MAATVTDTEGIIAIAAAVAAVLALIGCLALALRVRGLRIHRPLYRMQPKTARPGPSLRAFLGLLEAQVVTGLDGA